MELTNGFMELSSNDLVEICGGDINWGKLGYDKAIAWCNFWGSVGEGVYDILH